MKLLLWFSTVLLLLASCARGDGATMVDEWVPTTFVDSVAAAHGYAEWEDIEKLEFDFVVEVADTARTNRKWQWYPHRDSVVRTVGEERVGFSRKETLDATQTKADEQFVNDSYWVFMPFHLLWAQDSYTSTLSRNERAPLSKSRMRKLTVQYDSVGGYTPGDGYDLYIDDAYHLREWTFRKGGQAAPTMVMSWDGYRDTEGLQLPTTHAGTGPVQILHPTLAAYRIQ